jgi:AcrR family transcriptional regulator
MLQKCTGWYNDPMISRDTRREAVLEPIADHLLAHGIGGASLRAMAAAAGTSDRMLLYYFADKDELLAASLAHVAARLAALLEVAVPAAPPRPFATLLAEVWAAIRTPQLQAFMHLWLEVAARAGRGEEPYRAIAPRIAEGFTGWAATRLDLGEGGDRLAEAALLSATVDGLSLFAAVGQGGAADRAATALLRGAAPAGVSPSGRRSGTPGSPPGRGSGSARSR